MIYTCTQILLHWLVAALIYGQWLTYDAISRTHNPLLGASDADLFEHALHTYGGILIGILIGLRLLLRWHGRGHPVADSPRWETRVAGAVHMALYGLIFAQAVTGFLASYVTGAAMRVHTALWSLVWPLIMLHVLAAGYHLLRQDGTLSRMLTLRRRNR